MSQDMVGAVSGAHMDRSEMIERHRTQMETVDMWTLEPPSGPVSNGGATVHKPGKIEPQVDSAMDLHALAGQFSNGLQHGFYANDIDRLMHKLEQSHQSGSGITFGDVTVELLNVQAKVGIADAFSKVSSKLSEGLQTMVVKQG